MDSQHQAASGTPGAMELEPTQHLDPLIMEIDETQGAEKRKLSEDSQDEDTPKKKTHDTMARARGAIAEASLELADLGGKYYSEPIGGVLQKAADALSTLSRLLLDLDSDIGRTVNPARKNAICNCIAQKEPNIQKQTMRKAGAKLQNAVPTSQKAKPGAVQSGAQNTQAAKKKKPDGLTNTESLDSKEDGSPEPNNKENWTDVVKKLRKEKVLTPVKPASTLPKKRQKPIAVLVKLGSKSYADTLRQTRRIDIDFESLGTHVTGMRKTKTGDLLVELTRGSKAEQAAQLIKNKIEEAIPEVSASTMRQLTEIEILDLDDETTETEVRNAILQWAESKGISQEGITVGGCWSLKQGKMATAKVPIQMANNPIKLRIGWTLCRVRPRRPTPERCFRCHGFGHTAKTCTGPDLSGACRRCGGIDHKEVQCTEGQDRCLACERSGYPKTVHRPGSGACQALRAAREKNGK